MPLASGCRMMVSWLQFVVPLLVVMVWTSDASAYAWMMKHGYAKCSTCHADPSGGELLNHMGRVESEQLLSMDWDTPTPTSTSKLLYALDEPDSLLLGGSARYMGIYDLDDSELTHFPMQIDAYGMFEASSFKAGGSIGYASVKPNAAHSRGAQIFKTEEGGTLISRSHWLGVDIGDNWLMRLGRLNLPFGIRTSEHVLAVRDATKTDRESDQQHGLAFAYSGGQWRGEGMFVAGNFQMRPDDFRERGFVGFLERQLSRDLAVGLNALALTSSKSQLAARDSRTIRHAYGATLRYVAMSELMLMGEFDVLKMTGSGMGYTGMLNADYELMRGLHLSVTGEVLDKGKPDASEDGFQGAGEMSWTAWGSVQWFFATHWDLRTDVTKTKGAGAKIQSQIHFYF